tara:strand:+ start:110 stop:409 length:300 start_codon:yes stop_codon:yes gene_type:complete
MCFPKVPEMPSAAEMQKQQLETQRALQRDADDRAAGELADERRRARRTQIRQSARRRGRSSLITRRDIAGGLFGATDTGAAANTITPLNPGITNSISNY